MSQVRIFRSFLNFKKRGIINEACFNYPWVFISCIHCGEGFAFEVKIRKYILCSQFDFPHIRSIYMVVWVYHFFVCDDNSIFLSTPLFVWFVVKSPVMGVMRSCPAAA